MAAAGIADIGMALDRLYATTDIAVTEESPIHLIAARRATKRTLPVILRWMLPLLLFLILLFMLWWMLLLFFILIIM